MTTLTRKHWAALIGAVLVLLIIVLGWGSAALVLFGGIVGYLIGRFLDGELDLADLQRRR